jgi:hypothetical protein
VNSFKQMQQGLPLPDTYNATNVTSDEPDISLTIYPVYGILIHALTGQLAEGPCLIMIGAPTLVDWIRDVTYEGHIALRKYLLQSG